MIGCKICNKELEEVNYGQRYCSNECRKIWNRQRNGKYRETAKGKERLKYGKLKYNRTNKIKVYVRELTRHSQKKERICLFCGEDTKTQFHHLSYSPNIFFEVCLGCHEKIHHNPNFKVRFCRDLRRKK